MEELNGANVVNVNMEPAKKKKRYTSGYHLFLQDASVSEKVFFNSRDFVCQRVRHKRKFIYFIKAGLWDGGISLFFSRISAYSLYWQGALHFKNIS